MNSLRLEPISRVAGEVNLPGSKSVSNRALLLAALARGTTRLTNLLDSDDIRHMLAALTQLGVKYKLSADKTECTVQGLGRSFAVKEPVNLFLGNAGTAMRPLCAALCLGSGEYTLGGEPRMEERPIGHLVDALREAGAHIQYLKKDGYPPLVVDAKGLWGGDVHVDGSVSSQFLTAFLMAAPMAAGDTRIHIKGELVSKPYIDITLHIMKQFGVVIEHDNYKLFYIKGNQSYVSPGDFLVEGDASSASYFLAAGAIKGKVRVTGIGKHSIQGDIHFADVLEKMGARITWGDDFIEAEQAPLHGIDMDMNHIPDAAMTIAVAALFAEGPTSIRNIYNWRVKETDRLHAMATELRKLGVEVEEGHDFITVTPPAQLKHAAIDTYNDHRIAMCFSLVALSDTAVTINDPGCTSKTFPDYFDKLASVSQAV
ncbi:3-phosphoshikimate 1-carboxyvinyltransferase [Aeromonas bestiarum]|uniref:3-phosphoshikimate 1-carboxyvinyltransferase n=1 Tax=Aeromonas bestiarum TaxID=105751 RepID=A0AAW7HQE4_9GAMM|nr:3-phosphoshikimate 1-carboxyvinyltransferase [Aeromonas bestiarum]MDM5138196.1 3-phosphoshikimate 1-carboxyvinyltransferase [Aeromonas bestiarum]